MPLTSLAMLALAATTARAVDFSQWSPAGAGDSRGPCPGLNALANHGILPHDGQGLTIPTVAQAVHDAFNLDLELGTALSINALLTSPNPLAMHFELADLDRHNAIEHDGSLTRADVGERGADDHSFRPDLYAQFMQAFAGLDATTTESAAKAKVARVSAEAAADASFSYGALQFLNSYLETSLYLLVLGRGNDSAPLPWMDAFFVHEQVPADQGWTAPAAPITIRALTEHAFHIADIAGENAPDGVVINQNTVVAALLGLDNAGHTVRGWIQTWLNTFGFGSLLQGQS